VKSKTKYKLVIRYSLLVISYSLLLTRCIDSNIVTFETHSIPGQVWNYKDTISFKAEITDIDHWYDCYVDIRNAGNYPYSNLYLFITTRYPDNKMTRDTVQEILADDNGKWLGKGLGDIKDNRLLLRKGLKFPVKGIYTFKFVQAMRITDLKGISDIGLRIEKEN
jgi:gliding motility-associated lipoprotein GldH